MGKMIYYTLRLNGDTGFYHSGDEFKACKETLIIGEHTDCDIRFESPEGYAPEYYAAILPNGDDTWRLVPMSDKVATAVSGLGKVNNLCTLADGDMISFSASGASLKFRRHHDSSYQDTGRIVVSRPNNSTTYALFAFTLIVLGALSMFFYKSMRQISYEDMEQYAESVYKIRVDSVDCLRLVNGVADSVMWVEDFADGVSEMGTAFLCEDGRMITARHCVEYWIGRDPDLQLSIDDLHPADIIRRVANVETYNYINADTDTTYLLRSYCKVWNDADPQGLTFVSTDANVSINRAYDEMLVYDDFVNRHYWRSITPHHQRHDMALGDIVVVDTDRKGKIRLASAEVIRRLDNNEQVAILGYPESGFEQRTLDFYTGTYNHQLSSASGMIATKGGASHGCSGGPLFVRGEDGLVAIGLLSKVDPINTEFKYSVPLTNYQPN